MVEFETSGVVSARFSQNRAGFSRDLHDQDVDALPSLRGMVGMEAAGGLQQRSALSLPL